MKIFAHASSGFAGYLVSVEIDIRRGIPGLDIVGLPDGAVRESRDRVRVAMKRSGFDFPRDRILVNLSPAAVRKEGASYDLPIALGILYASGQLRGQEPDRLLSIGELLLDGTVVTVRGVLPAVAAAVGEGISHFLVPNDNLHEASALKKGAPAGISHLKELPKFFENTWPRMSFPPDNPQKRLTPDGESDISELKGQPILRRILEVAASGRHHILLFGPPGSGKSMACQTLGGLLPDLEGETALEVTRIWSQAGRLKSKGLIRRPPFRSPHHSASAEGLLGGGNGMKPGEVSLAHGGVLFLDETPEYSTRVLQSLREPLESRRVDMARASRSWWFPAGFMLALAMNGCACGGLGKDSGPCLCSLPELRRHWKRLGGALLDRIDLRLPVAPVGPEILLEPPGEDSLTVRARVTEARERQGRRFRGSGLRCNSDLGPQDINRYVILDKESRTYLAKAVRKLSLSSRAIHGSLRVARTLADMAGRDDVLCEDVLEALQYRRYGDRDLLWAELS